MPPALSEVSGVPWPARPCGCATIVAPEPDFSACGMRPSKASALTELSAVPSEAAVCVPVAVAPMVVDAMPERAPSTSAPALPQNQA